VSSNQTGHCGALRSSGTRRSSTPTASCARRPAPGSRWRSPTWDLRAEREDVLMHIDHLGDRRPLAYGPPGGELAPSLAPAVFG
jgi:hypothetical protein